MTSRKLYIPVFVIFILGIILGSFFDYQVSNALFVSKNPVGVFFAAVGEYPGYSVLSFLGAYVFSSTIKYYKKSYASIPLYIAGVAAVGAAVFFLGKAIFSVNGYNRTDLIFPIGTLLSALLLSPAVIFGAIFGYKTIRKSNILLAVIILLTIGIAIGLITVIKLIPHRPRFRTVSITDIPFKNWWERFSSYKDYFSDTITKEEFKSFPSGHVGITACILQLTYLPDLLDLKDKKRSKIVIFFVSFAYLLFLAYTRILVGAHFLSDVSFGGLISTSLFFILLWILNRYKSTFFQVE